MLKFEALHFTTPSYLRILVASGVDLTEFAQIGSKLPQLYYCKCDPVWLYHSIGVAVVKYIHTCSCMAVSQYHKASQTLSPYG
jgi:hypothetical protein